MQLRQKASHISNVVSEKVIQRYHMGFFTKEDVVRQVLNDLRNNHESSAERYTVLSLRNLDIDYLGRNDRRRDEPKGCSEV
jgi:hypothetical protein